jgi:hypothetical protein
LTLTKSYDQPRNGAPHGILLVKKGKSRHARRDQQPETAYFLPATLQRGIFCSLRSTISKRNCPSKIGGKRVNRFLPEFVLHSLHPTILLRLGDAGAEAFTMMKIAGNSSVTVSQHRVHPPFELWNLRFSDSKTSRPSAGNQRRSKARFGSYPLQLNRRLP